MAYQSLYRRYRPRTFAEIKGQDHVVSALRSAVRESRVGHAYLFHGPRGTGKTTTARVLAKALNCTDPTGDGEPCAACESCLSIEQNRSFDLHELDAASNNKVDDMRALLERVKLGTPGRVKVYLLDEAHMLTPGAENALLKTLEEPPDHVVWVLATTEPHKVVETIRSRCQVFELGLLGAEALAEHVRFVSADAGLDATEEVVDHVVAAGAGSVRDTLSALDRVVAAGGVVELDDSTGAILGALADRDPAAALAAVDAALGQGRDPRRIGEGVLSGLRNAFLTAMGSAPDRLAEPERAQAEALVSRMAPPFMTRALETLGAALVDMRQSPDPRVDLEVAMVRLARPAADRSLDALTDRVARLEAELGLGPPGPAEAALPGPPTARSAPPAQSSPRAPSASAGPAGDPPWPSASAGPAGDLSSPSASAGPAGDPSSPSASAGPAGDPPWPSASAGSAGDPFSSSVAGSSPSDDDGDRPVAQLRRTLAQSRGSIPSPSSPAADSSAPPPVPAVDLRDLRPQSSSEVVDLATRHLGLDRDEVVTRAKAMLPDDSPRNAETLAPVWLALVDSAESSSDQVKPPPPVPAPVPAAPVPDSGPPDPESDPGPPVPEPPESAALEPSTPVPPESEPSVPVPPESEPSVPVPPESEPPVPAQESEPLALQEPPGPGSAPLDNLVAQFKEAFPGAELITVDEDDAP